LLTVAAGLVVLALAGKTLGQALGGAIHLGGGNNTSQTTPSSATSTSTPQPVQIGKNTVGTTPGPLILLNPGVVRQGTGVGVTGSGFDPGAVIDLTITRQGSTTALATSFVQADKWGTFGNGDLTVPTSLSSGNFVVQAKERNSRNVAQAVGTIAGGAPQVKLGIQVGKPGDIVVLSLHGFAPEEAVNVYWNTLSGQPVTTLHADGGGSIGQAKIQVPFGAVGNNTFLFVGANSQSLVAANFLLLQLYPTIKLGSYALRADNVLTFSGSGFGPGERVFVFLNTTNSQPLAVVTTDATGSFKNAPGFLVPFTISGKQTLIFMGEQSRAPNAVAFTVEPYLPIVQASTYGGLPGMTISFYGTGFARNEVVHVYAGHTKSTMGTMVSCFQVDGTGSAAAAGSYLIPGDAQGTLTFALVGAKSGGVGVASLNITAPPAPVHTPPQPPFTCPLDPPAQPGPSGQTPPQGPSGQTPPQGPSGQTPPQGDLIHSSRQIALQPSASVSATTSHTGALLSLVAVSSLRAAPVNAHSARAGGARLSSALPDRIWWYILDQRRIPPLLVGFGLLWLIIVLVLNVTALWRSARKEAADHARARPKDAATGSSSHARVTAQRGQNTVSQHDVTRPSSALRAGTFEAQTQAQLGDIQHRLSGAAHQRMPPAGRRGAGPPIQAARCTAPWGGGRRSGHDSTFVQTNVRLIGEASPFDLFLVADGRSDGRTGITASQVVVEHIARRVHTAMSSGPGVPANLIRLLFKYAVLQAGDAVLARNAPYGTYAGTTVTGALVTGARAYIVNVGNSRAYLWRSKGGLWQITKNESAESSVVSAGLVGAKANDVAPQAQQLYQSLGDADQPIRVDAFALSMLPGDQLLLCSDGLWRKVDDAHIEAILRRAADPRKATWELIHAASANGSEEDISAIVVHVLGTDVRAELLPGT
jgi:serine/threonine protein phosphatase PrpC